MTVLKLNCLPDTLSYTPSTFSAGKDTQFYIARRDLFDARFQLISGSEETSLLQYFDTPADVVPGKYEGGLKTWECSVDLVEYLNAVNRNKPLAPADGDFKTIEVRGHPEPTL